jgi:hypothetical protein
MVRRGSTTWVGSRWVACQVVVMVRAYGELEPQVIAFMPPRFFAYQLSGSVADDF